jgi:hypothetical protein
MSSVAPRDIVRIGKMALADHIDQLVSHRPGMTELALAKSLFGRVGYQQRVNSTCRRLFREGHFERRGTGGPGYPFTYYPARITVKPNPPGFRIW